MYVLISRMKVAHYNAQQCKDIIMPVPVHGAVMFGHALGARLGKAVQGVALILHDAEVEQEWLPSVDRARGTRLLANKRGACAFYVVTPGNYGNQNGGGYASKSLYPAGMAYQMHVTANGCFSLALDLGNAHVTEDEIRAQLRAMRLAGGTIRKTGEIVMARTQQELASRFRSGFLVMDARARAESSLQDGIEPAHVFLHKHDDGYVVPAVVGYHLISDLSPDRHGIRRSPDIEVEGHAFAEAVVGLVEFIHVNRYRFTPETEADVTDVADGDSAPSPWPETSMFWRHGWTADDKTFLIQQPPKE